MKPERLMKKVQGRYFCNKTNLTKHPLIEQVILSRVQKK